MRGAPRIGRVDDAQGHGLVTGVGGQHVVPGQSHRRAPIVEVQEAERLRSGAIRHVDDRQPVIAHQKESIPALAQEQGVVALQILRCEGTQHLRVRWISHTPDVEPIGKAGQIGQAVFEHEPAGSRGGSVREPARW